MTDPTPTDRTALISEQLRNLELPGEPRYWVDEAIDALDRERSAREEAEAEVQRLRAVIEQAPHRYDCEHKNDTWMPGDGPIEDRCICWKSAATKGQDDDHN